MLVGICCALIIPVAILFEAGEKLFHFVRNYRSEKEAKLEAKIRRKIRREMRAMDAEKNAA